MSNRCKQLEVELFKEKGKHELLDKQLRVLSEELAL
jgi:hypothetical protein